MAVAKRELGRTGLQVTTLGYGAMELRGAPAGPRYHRRSSGNYS
jgi:aryl-alcohol dehydrogenase-like predicted oxidoreductase